MLPSENPLPVPGYTETALRGYMVIINNVLVTLELKAQEKGTGSGQESRSTTSRKVEVLIFGVKRIREVPV